MERVDEHITLYEVYQDEVDVEVKNKIINLMCIFNQEKVFSSSLVRLFKSVSAKLIKYDENDVGFIMAVAEDRLPGPFFIDMSILKEYRGKKIGYKVLDYFVNYYHKTYFIGEVSEDNIASNNISSKIGKMFAPGYYILPASNYDKAIKENKLDDFIVGVAKIQESKSEIFSRRSRSK